MSGKGRAEHEPENDRDGRDYGYAGGHGLACAGAAGGSGAMAVHAAATVGDGANRA